MCYTYITNVYQKMNQKKIFTGAIFLSLFLPLLTQAASFSYTPMETIPGFATDGNFYNYIAAVYKFGIWGVGISALLMITIGGYMYMMSAANVASAEKAKGVITDAIIGLILALVSYLLLYEINPNLVRLDQGKIASTAIHPPTGSVDEIALRKQLSAAGISINHANACAAGETSGCTTIEGLKSETISGIIKLRESCPTCQLTITGGSEDGHAAATYSHANGYKIDLSLNSRLTTFIESNYSSTGVRSDGSPTYTDSSNNIYAKEGDHWDVCYNCK